MTIAIPIYNSDVTPATVIEPNVLAIIIAAEKMTLPRGPSLSAWLSGGGSHD